MSRGLSDKVVLVTGGTRGMGEAEVRGLIEAGACVAFGGRDEVAGLSIAKSLGERCVYVRHDVAEEESWREFVDTALKRFGCITSLVNNAGLQLVAPVEKSKVADLDRLYQVNQRGTLLGIKHAVQPMRDAGGGSIVNLGSPAGVKGLRGLSGYAGTKAAISGITKAAAVELADDRIRVNMIVPGFFDTQLLSEATGGKGAAMGAKLTPIGRTAQPEEIVGTVAYLLSDESLFVTGAEIRVDGGYTA